MSGQPGEEFDQKENLTTQTSTSPSGEVLDNSHSDILSFDAIEHSLTVYESDLQRRRNLPESEKGHISQATFERDLRRKRGEMYQHVIDQQIEALEKRFGVGDRNALKVENLPELLQHAAKNEVFRNVLIIAIEKWVDQKPGNPIDDAEFKLQQMQKIYDAATSDAPSDGQVSRSWAERRVRGIRREIALRILSNDQNIPLVKEYIKNAEEYVSSEKEKGNKTITEWPEGSLELAFHMRRIMTEQKRKGKSTTQLDDVVSTPMSHSDEERGDQVLLGVQENKDESKGEKRDETTVNELRDERPENSEIQYQTDSFQKVADTNQEEKQNTERSNVEDIIKTFAPTEEEPKKRGLFSRLFGGKK